MGPTQVREPFHRDGWVFEEKVDGWRILADKDGNRVRLGQSQWPRPHATLSRHRGCGREVLSSHTRTRRRGRDLRSEVSVTVRLVAQARPGRCRHATDADNDLVLPVRRLAPDGRKAWAEVV